MGDNRNWEDCLNTSDIDSNTAWASRDDERVTHRLADAAELIGIALLDHLVVGSAGWTSLARRGLLG